MQLAVKLVVCAMMLLNKCIEMGDLGEDFVDLPDSSALQDDWLPNPDGNSTAGQATPILS